MRTDYYKIYIYKKCTLHLEAQIYQTGYLSKILKQLPNLFTYTR